MNIEDLAINREYVLNHAKELSLDLTQKPLFVNGLFSEDNWNGGDDLIRQFTSYICSKDKWDHIFTLS